MNCIWKEIKQLQSQENNKSSNMENLKILTDKLNNLINDEDLTDEKLQEASESLLPNIACELNNLFRQSAPKQSAGVWDIAIAILQENYEAAVRSKESKFNAFPKNSVNSVIETYEDLIAIFKNKKATKDEGQQLQSQQQEDIAMQGSVDWKTKAEVELSAIARTRHFDFTLPSEYALGWRQCIDWIEKEYAAQPKAIPLSDEEITELSFKEYPYITIGNEVANGYHLCREAYFKGFKACLQKGSGAQQISDEDELWNEVVKISNEFIVDIGVGMISNCIVGGKVIEELKKRFTILQKGSEDKIYG